MEGFRAFRQGLPRNTNPYDDKKRKAWDQGWCMAQDKQKEKELCHKEKTL